MLGVSFPENKPFSFSLSLVWLLGDLLQPLLFSAESQILLDKPFSLPFSDLVFCWRNVAKQRMGDNTSWGSLGPSDQTAGAFLLQLPLPRALCAT